MGQIPLRQNTVYCSQIYTSVQCELCRRTFTQVTFDDFFLCVQYDSDLCYLILNQDYDTHLGHEEQFYET